MRIRILDEAEQDLVEGFQFYEDRESGLGDYFLDSLFADIDSLQLFAGIHAKQFGYFRLLAHRFPFAIYYKVFRKIVRVYAVLDCRRDPALLGERLK